MRYKIGISREHPLNRGNARIELTPNVAIINTARNKGIELGWFGCHIFLGSLDLGTLRNLQESGEADPRLEEETPKES